MNDYIPREAANKWICETCDGCEGTFCAPCDGNPLKDIPASDVVEVVHCRDCKHYDCEDGDQKCVKDAEWDEESACYYGFIAFHRPEFFCADGERKDGGKDNA